MGEVDSLKQDLDEFKSDVRAQFDGVRADLKDLTQALRDLIRLDGDIKRLQDAVGRIGLESDDHERRLRALEKADAHQAKSVGLFDGLVHHALVLLVGAVIGALLIKTAGG